MKNVPLKRTLMVLFLVVATELIGFGLIIPILPQIAAKYQSNGFLLGFLLAAYSLTQFIAAPLLGRLSDRYGRKPVLVLSKLGTVVAYVFFAFSKSYIWILVSRLLDGFTGGNISVARAYVADVTTPENRSKGMAIIGIAFGTGFVLGPALGGFLYTAEWGHMMAAFVAGGLSLLAAIFTIVFLEEPQRKISVKVSFLNSLRTIPLGPVIAILITLFGYMVLFSGFETSFSVFTHDMLQFTERQNSWLFVYVGCFAFLVQGGIARIKTTRHKPIIISGIIFMGISFGLLAFTRELPMLLVALGVMALGFGLLNCFMPALLSLHCTVDNRGSVMGVYEGISSLSRVVGPLVVYSVFAGSFKLGYALFSGVLLVIMVFFWLVYRVSFVNQSKEGVLI